MSTSARLTERLVELRAEREAGERLLAELDGRRTAIRDTLLRIDGAIQVLEEELARETAAPGTEGLRAEPIHGSDT